MAIRSARSWFGGAALDLRYVARVLAASPVFTTVAIVSLAIGIGANTAIFGAARVALLDPMPVDEPGNLRLVHWTSPDGLGVSQLNSGGGVDPASGRRYRTNFSWPTYLALRNADAIPAELFGFNFLMDVTVAVPDRPPTSGGGLMVSGNYFSVLRPPVALGRGLSMQDDGPSSTPVVVLGHEFWTRALGADPNVLGQVVAINDVPFAIVGVTAQGYRGLSTGGRVTPLADVTVPLATQPLIWNPDELPLQTTTDRLWIRMMARLESEDREDATAAALTPVLRRSVEETGLVTEQELADVAPLLAPGGRGVDALSRSAERPLLILAGVGGVVLLIACVNLASLMLARGMARQREMSIRRALGAGRLRLIRQLLAESAVLAVLGGSAGLLLSWWAAPVIGSMMATGLGADAVEIPLDGRSLAATSLVAGGAMMLSGLLPALRLSRTRDATHLRHQVIGASAPRATVGRVLLALQIGISVPLVVTAGLLLQTVQNLGQVDLGFNPEGLAVFRIDPGSGQPMESDAVALFYGRLLEGLEAIPGVTSATMMENALVTGWVSNNSATINGQPRQIYMNAIGPRYFDTLEIPLVAGRALDARDNASAPNVVVINQTAAREFFGATAPLGRRFTYGRTEAEVVGVVADSKYGSVRGDIPPTLFDSIFQRGRASANVAVRTATAMAGLETAIIEAVSATGVQVPVTEFRTQLDQIDRNIGRERLMTGLLGAFGGFAILLACVGLYGVTAYSVARRTNEIGIRVALGAQRAHVLWLVLRQVLLLAVAGLIIGIPTALAAGPLVGSFLYGLGPRDASTVAIASGVMLLVAFGAGLLPARRAARLQVLTALRRE